MMFIGLFAIHWLLIITNQIEAAPQNQNRQSKSAISLYSTSDGVDILTANNFNEKIYNSTSASLVQFYDSLSEHCIKYAPFYKELASSVQNWKNVIKVAVIDCSESQNAQICQQHVVKDYPTIRYFPPELKSQTIGEPVSKNMTDPAAIRREILNQLVKTEPKMRHHPEFSAANADSFESLQEMSNGNLLILVVEKENSHMGHELMMDLFGTGIRNVMVRSSHNQKLSDIKEQLPQIFVLKSGYVPKQLTLKNPTRHRVFKLVQNYLMKEGYNVPINSEVHGQHSKQQEGSTEQNENQNSEQFLAIEQFEKFKLSEKEAEAALQPFSLFINSMTTAFQDKIVEKQQE